jgi:hypothetical protein
MLSIAIEKTDGGNSVIEVSVAKRSGATGIITELTDRIGVARLSTSGQATISSNIKVDLAHNDEIILIGRRSSGSISVKVGAGLDVIEL